MKLSKTATSVMHLVKAQIREEILVANSQDPELQLAKRWNACAPIVDRAINQAFAHAQATMLRELESPLLLETVRFPEITHGQSDVPIHVHMATSWNTLDYAHYARQNLQGLAFDPANLRFTLYCLDERVYEFVQIHDAFRAVAAILVSDDDAGRGSEQHALAIQRMLGNTVTDEHHVVADSDVVILKPGWDEFLRGQLRDNDVFGIEYDKTDNNTYYLGNPSLTWLAIGRKVNLRGFDPYPRKHESVIIDSLDLSELYKLPLGSQMVCDTGWRLPTYVQQHMLRVVSVPVTKPSN